MHWLFDWIDPEQNGFWTHEWNLISAAATAVGALLLLLVSPAIRDSWAFLFLYGVNLIIHEAGHLIFWPTGIEFLAFAGGTLIQLLMPAAFWIHFMRHEQPKSSDVCLIWLGQSLLSTGFYIADAREQALPLLAEDGEHDWAYMLGALGLLRFDKLLGFLTDVAGCALISIAVFSLIVRFRQNRV